LKKNNKRTTQHKPKNPRSKIVNEAVFILLAALGIYILIAFVTRVPHEVFFTLAPDTPASLSEYENKAGKLGAMLADGFINALFGKYVAYIIPISLLWLGYNFHKNADKERKDPLIYIFRLIAYFVMLFFAAALAHQYAGTYTIGSYQDVYFSGGWIGKAIHENYGGFFGAASTVIYVGIILVSFSITTSASWKNISKTMFSYNKTSNTVSKKQTAQINPSPNINNTQKFKPKEKAIKTKEAKKADKAEKPQKVESSNLYKATASSGLPGLSLLDDVNNSGLGYSEEFLEEMSQQVELKLKDFGFDVTITAVTPGPVVTQFEISLAPGVKVSQIMNLNKDLARALLVESVRIVDVIPGKPVIGLEIPNNNRELIGLKEILSSETFTKSKSTLSMGLGKDINGHPIVVDLSKMPHLLVAGATGMGKSVGLNAIILSILYKARPDQVRLIMIDPKIVELSCYADIPHLLTPVMTDMNEAASALWWCVNEMERRYTLLAKFSVRNIEAFNEKLLRAKKSDKPLLDPSFDPKTAKEGEQHPELEALPLIVIVIDEYADMLGALAQQDRAKSKRVEGLIVRIAQKARAAGVHLIVATQRPSVDVITGLIKSNIPTRISFKVSSKTDSRTILDQSGAEQLLGMGDMLYMTPGISHLTRVHGAYVEDSEIFRVVDHLKKNSDPNYLAGILSPQNESTGSQDSGYVTDELDPLFDEAVQIVTSTRRASISSLQRRMRIGYNRSARIIEDMEASGIVSSMNSAGNREVLAPKPIEPDD
jgi:S-DNA-T family DNA segregation ATPase FtsK/SpoIIIE